LDHKKNIYIRFNNKCFECHIKKKKKLKQSILVYLENKLPYENTFDKYQVIIVNNGEIQKTFNTH